MKILKWIGIILLLIIVAAASFYFIKQNEAKSRLSAVYKIEPAALEIPNDSLSIAQGSIWVNAICAECHGADLGGNLFFNEPSIGAIYAPNLTSGPGGIAYYSDKDWVRSIRHGVAANGRVLLAMPSKDYANMYKEDLSNVIAYAKTLPAVDKENGNTELKPFGNILLSVGAFGDAIGAEVIDHEAPIPSRPVSQSAIEQGDYIVRVFGCRTCHGKDLGGAESPDPNSPFASNIRSTGVIGNWTFDQFSSFTQTGTTAEGKEVNPQFMPWKALGRLPKDQQQAIFTYLKSLP